MAPKLGLTRPAPRTLFPPKENVKLLRTLDARHEEFLDYAAAVFHVSDATQAWYRQGYQNYRRFAVEGIRLVPEHFRVRLFALDEWVRWNTKRGIKPVTTNSYWRAVHSFFNDCERRDSAANPFELHDAPRMPARLPKALSETQCRRVLLAAANYPWRSRFLQRRAVALVATILYAGLRRSELLHLNFSDVNLIEGTIRVIAGKGRYGGKDRIAYIPPDLKYVLQDYLRERRSARFINPEFFSSSTGRGGISLSSLRRTFKELEKAAGFAFSPHILRHSYVTQMLKNGIPLHVAKELAGHNDIETTMGYLRVFDDEKRFQVKKIRYR
jgi:site-specific recombinase XerD